MTLKPPIRRGMSHTKASLRNAASDQRGLTILELSVVAALGAVVAAGMAAILITFTRAEVAASDQTQKLESAQLAFDRIETDVQFANFVSWCQPVGNCLIAGTSSAAPITVRYLYSTGTLYRSTYNSTTGAWSDPQPIIASLANTAPTFSCDASTSLARVNVKLSIEATHSGLSPYEFSSSFRPRNFPSSGVCPT